MKKTFIVMVFGYWGRSKVSLKDAAQQCHKAGGGRTNIASAKIILGDDDARISDGHIEYNQGSEVVELGIGFKLGHFLNLKD